MTPSQFYYMRSARDSENRLTVRSNVKRALPILWCRDGEHRLVPKEVVQNVIDSINMVDKMSDKVFHPVITIHWDQGVPVTNQVGRMLTGGE